MKFGVREICDVVLKAKAPQTIGNRTFAKDEPVIYFDSAKTSTLDGAVTPVYATGGKGNTRLIAWEGEKTVTFTMEDALLSPLGFAILSGAGLVEATAENKIKVHATTQVEGTVADNTIEVDLTSELKASETLHTEYIYGMIIGGDGSIKQTLTTGTVVGNVISFGAPTGVANGTKVVILVDYYVEKASGVQQLEVTADKFAGNYYLEASTLFRRQEDGVDLPAEFIIPNVKIQSNFTFSMASTGDPSTFTFTMDAFPDYTKFNKTKKYLFLLQIIED